jgi:hypothetical protein
MNNTRMTGLWDGTRLPSLPLSPQSLKKTSSPGKNSAWIIKFKINEAFARLESGKARNRIVLDADFRLCPRPILSRSTRAAAMPEGVGIHDLVTGGIKGGRNRIVRLE